MDSNEMNLPDQLAFDNNSSNGTGDLSEESSNSFYPMMTMPESISYSGKRKEDNDFTQKYLHGDISEFEVTHRINDISSDNYETVPSKLTINESRTYQKKPMWYKSESASMPSNNQNVPDDKISTNSVIEESQAPEEVTAAETSEMEDNESDDQISYQEFMQLRNDDKLINLYLRLRDQEERMRLLERKVKNNEASGIFGSITGMALCISSILALGYVYRKKLQL
ncbi:uncharacterized protein TRIADDRAFT_62342 [Trichoplax adhaerens]|uniref:Uncharacterized protein n=1 Tax=Trichoplax adhaerens TaxID=10228 RepID=B3SDI4_TRIAD|nr:predicted protein [Trichoplax adhaerens]EDV19238.1 predicted protein [Trichoplax adhaerens]|eukprot:XP_002118304.1 predicted protein [Trichoplax adhaerens]